MNPSQSRIIKYIVIAAFALITPIVIWKLFIQQPEIANYPSSGDTIIALGDSLTFGEGVKPSENYVSVLSGKLGTPIVNAGVSGDTTAMALARLPDILEKYPRPKLVIVMLGGNDFLQRLSKEETYANLSKIIAAIQARGAVVLLVGVRGGIFTDAFADEYNKLAKEYKTAYVPNILKGILGKPELLADTIHPNAKGHEKMAEKLESVVEKLLK